ncbi:AAA family ATPase [Dactylosporangium sp. CA-139066]|uniref:AAA family ATPase n=1 Tax=Dactylosporangium sp. CA-139066 TaxID=3239930 RepID=UPI003D8FCEE8
MQTLVRAMKGQGQDGRALPGAFSGLEAVGARLRYGQVALIVAAPGGAKSAVGLVWALRSGAKTLYFSADTDRFEIGKRLGAHFTRRTQDEVEAGLTGPESDKWYALIDSNTRNLWFSWEPAPSLDDIEDEVKAYAAVRGEWPELIVIDNLKNVWDDGGSAGDSDWVRYDRVVAALKELAQEIGAAVLILHHATGQYEDGYTPIPLNGILGKCAKDVRLALTLHRGPVGSNETRICVVKNNGNKADPGGGLIVPVPFWPERMYFGDLL